MSIPVEDIVDFLPNGKQSLLYYRIHETYKRESDLSIITPSAFKYSKVDKKMSTNWSKYSDANGARIGARKPPEEYGVVSLMVQKIRNENDLNRLAIEHAPLPNNKAHTNIDGLYEYEELSKEDLRNVQVLLSRLAVWEISFS